MKHSNHSLTSLTKRPVACGQERVFRALFHYIFKRLNFYLALLTERPPRDTLLGGGRVDETPPRYRGRGPRFGVGVGA